MNKVTGILIGVVVVVLLLIGSVVGKYNTIVTKEEKVDNAFANIDVQLERRADLIPNLVSTVKGYTTHEEKIIKEITEARSNLLKANTVSEKMEANNELTKSLDALMVIVENYPDLKASENFVNLQDELAGTENRISTARRDYNDAVNSYNQAIKTFPGNVVAGIFGKEKKTYFEVDNSKKEVPSVDFE